MICENCGHEIKKVTFIRNEQSMKEYRHKEGGKLSTMIFSLIGELQGTILALKLKNADRR